MLTKSTTPNLQFKLALDSRLSSTWHKLEREYGTLDKSAIVRLALDTLAKQTLVRTGPLTDPLWMALDYEASQRKVGISEDEFSEWWAVNKADIIKNAP